MVVERESDGRPAMLEARRGAHTGGSRPPTHGCHHVLVLVDGVDEQLQRARRAGARIIAEPESKQ